MGNGKSSHYHPAQVPPGFAAVFVHQTAKLPPPQPQPMPPSRWGGYCLHLGREALQSHKMAFPSAMCLPACPQPFRFIMGLAQLALLHTLGNLQPD